MIGTDIRLQPWATGKLRRRQRALLERQFEILAREKDDHAAAKALGELCTEMRRNRSKQEQEWLESVGFVPESDIRMMAAPWFRHLIAIDPQQVLKRVHCPVLALIGERDLQVPAKENARLLRAVLTPNGNRHGTVLELPNLNHLFQTCQTGALSEYSKIEETIAPAALRTIGDWVVQRAAGNPIQRLEPAKSKNKAAAANERHSNP